MSSGRTPAQFAVLHAFTDASNDVIETCVKIALVIECAGVAVPPGAMPSYTFRVYYILSSMASYGVDLHLDHTALLLTGMVHSSSHQ